MIDHHEPENASMSERDRDVDFYGSQYGSFRTDLYAEIRAEIFDEDIGQNGWLTVSEQDLFLEWLGLGPGDRLLDIACGSGGPTLRMASATGCLADGIDLHAEAINAALAAAAEQKLDSRVSFSQADGSARLPFEDASFNAVTCIDAVNHLPDRMKVFSEWYRVLKPGGRAVFTDPIVVSGPLTDDEIAIRASIGFFLFVPDGFDDRALESVRFSIVHREDRTSNMAEIAATWRQARAARETALRSVEGDAGFDGQQTFLNVCAQLAEEKRLSRVAYCAVKT